MYVSKKNHYCPMKVYNQLCNLLDYAMFSVLREDRLDFSVLLGQAKRTQKINRTIMKKIAIISYS